MKKVGHGGDRHIRTGINGFDEGFELHGLEPVDHHIQHGFGSARIKTAGVQNGQAGAELLRNLLRDLVGAGGNDHGGLGAVEAVHDEVHGFGAGRIGDDGIERQNPAVHGDAADDVQSHVVNQHKVAHGETQRLCKDDGGHLDAVHGAAVADGKAAAHAGDDSAEQGAQKQVGAGQRGSNADVDGQNVRYEPGRRGVDTDGEDGVDGEHGPLPLEPKQKQWDVQHNQEKRQGERGGRQLGKQDGRAGDAAVVQLHRRNKQRYTDGIDDSGREKHQEVKGRKSGDKFFQNAPPWSWMNLRIIFLVIDISI